MIKRNLVSRLFTAALAIITVSLASCVKETFVDCPPDVRLLIKTDEDALRYGEPGGTRAESRAGDPEEWYNSIDSIDVYVFDENEKFVTLWKGGPYTPRVDYEVPLRELRLKEGVYTFVAWSNSDERLDSLGGSCYYSNFEELMHSVQPGDPGEEGEEESAPQTPETEREFFLSDLRMDIKHPEDGLYDEDSEFFPHRHYGILRRAYVSNNSIQTGDNTIEIFPSIHKVIFSVIDANADSLSGRTLTVVDKNSAHDFFNRPIAEQEYRVRRPLNLDVVTPQEPEEPETRADAAPTLSTEMYLMQLDDNTTTSVEIHNTDDPDNPVQVYRVRNLVELIQNTYNFNDQPLDFDERLEFNISLDIRGYPQIVLIVNGWRYTYQHIDM